MHFMLQHLPSRTHDTANARHVISDIYSTLLSRCKQAHLGVLLGSAEFKDVACVAFEYDIFSLQALRVLHKLHASSCSAQKTQMQIPIMRCRTDTQSLLCVQQCANSIHAL
jgi:hypothetical protein